MVDLRCYVASKFDNFVEPVLGIKYWVVSRAQPDGIPVPVNALEAAREKLTCVQPCPEPLVFSRVRFLRRAKQSVMLAQDVF